MDTAYASFAAHDGDGQTTLDGTTLNSGMIFQSPIRELGEREEATAPQWILVRQIGFIDGPDGPFGYIGPDKPRAYSAAAFEQILDELRQGSYAPMPAAESFNRPLDLFLDGTTVFVFHLSNQRNWRFTRGVKAVTLGAFADPLERQNYYGLRHVLNGSVGTPEPPEAGNCKICYFTGKRTSERFAHKFNINVELIYTNDCEGANTLPIVIDPDVRYPGGSGSE